MTTLEKETIGETLQEFDKKLLCHKLCANILEGLLEGYNELKARNPDKEKDFQIKIEELKKQLIIH